MHPNSYLTPFPDRFGSYTLQAGGDINDTLSTPLHPFSADTQGHFYTSSMVQFLRIFGYSYPEIHDWSQNSKDLQAHVTGRVNTLYGPSASKSKRIHISKRVQTNAWSVSISVSKSDLDGQRFVIHVFLEDAPLHPFVRPLSKICVGSFPVLPPVSHTPISQALPPSHHEISLTEMLKARGYDGRESNATAKYLEKALSWEVQLV